MEQVKDSITLNNGVEIPCVAFGTWKISNEEVKKPVLSALKAGYRHIDTAAFYGNEIGIGKAVRESGIAREEIFITSKVWNSDQGYEECRDAFFQSLDRLGTSYLDLYLIHWPIAAAYKQEWQTRVCETWRAMEELYQEGKVRAIGVSNFMPHHLEVLLEKAKVIPAVDQIEFHPGMLEQQEETIRFCREKNIQLEAWAPLARTAVFGVSVLEKLAQAYQKSVAQITLRWELQKGIIPLPKSVTEQRILENSQLFDFALTKEDMEKIDSITQDQCPGSGQHPDHIEFL